MNILGKFLAEKRMEHQVTQKEICRKLDPPITSQYWSLIETGKMPLPVRYMATVCNVLNLYPQELVLMMEKDYGERVKAKSGLFQKTEEKRNVYRVVHKVSQ